MRHKLQLHKLLVQQFIFNIIARPPHFLCSSSFSISELVRIFCAAVHLQYHRSSVFFVQQFIFNIIARPYFLCSSSSSIPSLVRIFCAAVHLQYHRSRIFCAAVHPPYHSSSVLLVQQFIFNIIARPYFLCSSSFSIP